MRFLSLVAIFLMVTVPACAQDTGRDKAAVPPPTKTAVEILGKTYQLDPSAVVDITVEWDTVKDYVPPQLKEAPPFPLTDEEIYNEIKRAREIYQKESERCIAQATDAYMVENPDAEPSYIELVIAEEFMAGDGVKYSQDCQAYYYAYMAGLYVEDMFGNRMAPAPKAP